jgi:hypothetical protein
MKRNGAPNPTFNETRDKVKAWLSDEGCTHSKSMQHGYEWVLNASEGTEKGAFGFTIGQHVTHTLILSMSIELHLYQPELRKLNPAQTKDLLAALRQRLLVIGTEFSMGEGLANIWFQEKLYVEGLSREKFWEAANRIKRAMWSATWTLDEKLPEPSSR